MRSIKATLVALVVLFTSTPCLYSSPPYPPSPVIDGMKLDWATHQRYAAGSDNWQLTWADDNHLYGAWGDGGGFGGTNEDGRVSLGVARVEGPWNKYKGYNVWGGKNTENLAQFMGKSWGMICIDGIFYMWVVPDYSNNGAKYIWHYSEARLAKSTDHGAHWTKANWAFFESEKLIIPTICNFGKTMPALVITMFIITLSVHRIICRLATGKGWPKVLLCISREGFIWQGWIKAGYLTVATITNSLPAVTRTVRRNGVVFQRNSRYLKTKRVQAGA